jgi:hypothetical protein
LIEPLNKRIKEILAEGMKNDTQDIRFILNEDVIAYNPKADKQKKLLPNRREKKKKRGQWKRFEIEQDFE